MPALLNWPLRLLPTNPICMRLVQGGSRRPRHMLIRSAYLAVMIVVLAFALLSTIGVTPSVRQLARAGAQTFTWISYLQVILICLLTPVFMAGAIAQEANPRTWDIMLTTPLGNLQIVLGNLFGRLFFILALLFSTLPLFAVTQYYGGVPGRSIFASYGIAVPRGVVASTPLEARQAVQDLGGQGVLKAQIHAGGRGQAGGVKVARSPDEADQMAQSMFNLHK